MPDATVSDRSHAFAHPDLTNFCCLNELGLVVTGNTNISYIGAPLGPDLPMTASSLVRLQLSSDNRAASSPQPALGLSPQFTET